MNIRNVHAPAVARRRRVVALHCSGAGAGQWRQLAEALNDSYELLTPEHYGCDSSGPWTGEHVFTLADEAARTIALIDQCDEKVHLVGHSYGGGVALHVALARHDRIASMALYEPSVFHLLIQIGGPALAAREEVIRLVQRVSQGILVGDCRGAIAAFVDYWNGSGAWQAMRPAVQNALIRWAPKAPLDFSALINEQTPASAYRALHFPVLILRGEHAPRPTRLLAEHLFDLLPAGQLTVIADAGHMGPLTHAAEVSASIAQHIAGVERDARLQRWPARAA